MACPTQDICIKYGKTFSQVVRWESTPLVYKPITAIANSGPVSITATAHGLQTGWRAAVLSVVGMRQINANSHGDVSKLSDTDFNQVTVPDANTITINDTNSLSYDAYISGGTLVYYSMVDMTSFTATMPVYATEDDPINGVAPIFTLGTATGEIVLDNVGKTITVTIPALYVFPAAFIPGGGFYSLLMGSPAAPSVVTEILKGNITLTV